MIISGRLVALLSVGALFAFTEIAPFTNTARGAAYWEGDYTVVENAPSQQPADLPHPNSDAMAELSYGAGYASGVAIGENWILTAHHVGAGIVRPNYDPFDADFVLGSTTYRVKADPITDAPMAFFYGTQPSQYPEWPPIEDFALFRIEKMNGDDADLASWVGVSKSPSIGNVTIGGFGQRNSVDEETGSYGQVLGSGDLRWGRNEATFSNYQINVNLDHPSSSDYIKYESVPRPGDSGGGWFFRDGWEWRVAGVTSGPSSLNGVNGATISASVLSWIQSVLGADYQSPPIQSKPSPTTTWIGAVDDDWSNNGNWSGGIPSLTSSDGDTVVIVDQYVDVAVYSSAKAKDVFVGGAASQNSAAITINGGDLLVNGLFVGAESSDYGNVTLYDGTLDSEIQYIGYRGTGKVSHQGGSNSSSLMIVGSEATAGTGGTYTLFGASTTQAAPNVNASELIIGRNSGSVGKFRINAGVSTPYAVLQTDRTIVGIEGSGTFLHQGGSHTTNLLTVSEESTYEITAGTLNATQIDVEGTFKPKGGNVNSSGIVVSGVVDFDGTTNTTQLSGIVDLSQASIDEGSQATLAFPSDALVLLNAAAVQSGVDFNTSGQSPHVVGSGGITIDQYTVHGSGVLTDMVIVSGGATELGGLEATGGSIRLEGGLRKDGAATVDLGPVGSVDVPTGKAQLNSASVISASTGEFNAEKVTISTDGRLFADGNLHFDGSAEFGLSNGGVLEIGNEIGAVGTLALTGNGLYEQSGSQAEIVFDVENESSYDTFEASQLLVFSNGTDLYPKLSVSMDSDNIDELEIEETFSLITFPEESESSALFGTRSVIVDDVYGGTIVTGSQGTIGLALLYPGNDYILNGVELEVGSEFLLRVTLPGDANFNNVVDAGDLAILSSNYSNDSKNKRWRQGDFTGDGKVDVADLAVLSAHYGESWPGGGGGAGGVPEPTSALLLLVGIAIVAFDRDKAHRSCVTTKHNF
jgi:hypothetical protein